MSIVTMLSRMFMQRMLRWGMRRGTAALTRSGTRKAGMGKTGISKAGTGKAGSGTAGRMSQADSAQTKATRLAVKRARQAARVTRRLGR